MVASACLGSSPACASLHGSSIACTTMMAAGVWLWLIAIKERDVVIANELH